MHKGRVSLVAVPLVAAFALSLTGCGRGTIIRVNGDKINKSEFYAKLEAVPVQTPQGAQPAGRYIVEQMIKEKLITQLAKKENVAPTEEQINKKLANLKRISGGDFERSLAAQGLNIQTWKTQQTLQQALINVVTKDVDVPDSDVKKAYDQLINMNPSPLKRPEQVLISVIVCKDKAKIDKAYAMLNQGQEFGTVAMRMSEAPGADKSQGLLDYVSRDDKRAPQVIRTNAFSLQPTKYSKPLQVSPTQWVILKADQKRPAKVQAFDDVKDVLQEQMKMQKGSASGKFMERMQKFLQESDITMKIERYKNVPEDMKKQAAKALEEEAKKLPKLGATSQPNQ